MKCGEKWERTGQDRGVRNGGGEASRLVSPPGFHRRQSPEQAVLLGPGGIITGMIQSECTLWQLD